MQKFAGEHYIIDELRKHGFNPEILPKKGNNAPEIRVNNKIIQVRTRKDSNPGWLMHSKAEELSASDYFYAFVNLNEETGKPIFRIVPSATVAKSVYEDHQRWLNGKSKIVTKRKDTSMRKFYDRNGEFVNSWDLLK